MKTVAEIAAEIGVSKQAIFYRIRKPPLSNALRSLTTKTLNVLTIEDDGVTLIKQAFEMEIVKENVKRTSKESSNENTSFDGKLIEILKENIEVSQECITVLQEQLKVKDKQIEELTATVKNLSESINAANKNELAETIIDGNKKLIEENKSKKRGGIFKIFSRKE
jgi:hypothetical protein